MDELLWAVPAVLTGYLVLGLTGFGSALVIVPLLAWSWPLPEVVALILMLDLPASLMHSGLNWRQVQWPELRRLLPGIALGTLAGLWLSHHLHSRWPLLALGLYVAVVGWRAQRAGQTRLPLNGRWGLVYGSGIGIVEMLFGTAGPVVVAWLTRRLPDPHQVRASIPMVMAVAVLTVLCGMAWDGRLSQPVLWQRWAVLIAPALAGVWLGHRLAHRLPVARLRQAICALLVVSGSVLVAKALG
ncbi:MAG: sulfite exporter TauE/SafE family protein [Limnohabitans sp.]